MTRKRWVRVTDSGDRVSFINLDNVLQINEISVRYNQRQLRSRIYFTAEPNRYIEYQEAPTTILGKEGGEA